MFIVPTEQTDHYIPAMTVKAKWLGYGFLCGRGNVSEEKENAFPLHVAYIPVHMLGHEQEKGTVLHIVYLRLLHMHLKLNHFYLLTVKLEYPNTSDLHCTQKLPLKSPA